MKTSKEYINMNFYWVYPVFILVLFVVFQYIHQYVDKKVAADSISYHQFIRICTYVFISSMVTSVLFTTFSDNIQEFVCTVFNLPFERTKENVEVFTGDPTF